MQFISNRGNINGPDLSQENNPEYVNKALEQNFFVIVDAWVVPTDDPNMVNLALGANTAQYPVTLDLLQNPRIIARIKDLNTFQILTDKNVHCVLDGPGHQITTNSLIFNPIGGRQILPRTIINMPEVLTTDYESILPSIKTGICSNYIADVRDAYDALSKSRIPDKNLDTIPENKDEENDEDNDDGDENVVVLS